MPTLRKDPIIDRWVIIASERSKRPNEYVATRETPTAEHCPFCRGHEDATPDPVHVVDGDDGEWAVRVVPNRFPALRHDGPEDGFD